MNISISRIILIGSSAAAVSAVCLAVAALSLGLSPLLPLKATAHVVLGPDAGLGGTAALLIGGMIHFASACFWAGVAVMILRPARRVGKWQLWLTGLGTALIAGAVDYLLMPQRLTPGWELVLPPWGVVMGMAGLGLGLSLGLLVSRALPPARATDRRLSHATPAPLDETPPVTGPDLLRMQGAHVIDQRQQRIDPTNQVTLDPNRNSGGPSSGR